MPQSAASCLGNENKTKTTTMSKKINLTIPEPCLESWDAMTKTFNGKFCGSCSKEVIDFSTMSDAQLIAYFQKPAGTVCGRFHEQQLNHEMILPKKPLPWAKYFFSVALPAFLFSFKANAQMGRVKAKVDTVNMPTHFPMALGMVSSGAKVSTIDSIKGTVRDTNGAPIAYATVMIDGKNIGTSCNAQGEFFLLNKEKSPVFINVSAVGYETQVIMAKGSSMNITLSQPLMGLVGTVGGVVVVRSSRKSKKVPLIERIADAVFTRFKVYPNPARSGSKVVVEWKKGETGDYTANLVSFAGQVVQSKEVVIESKAQLIMIDIPVTAPGTYVLSFRNKRSGKVYSQQVVVQ
ncbi:MAG: hypothetical protein JWP69_50 [Flaviaesturariibacter sp.]|nr:hypothetical protein [Flaviaesturariibacter sp.]